jgi:SHAQKYF class myb-like DNA-binding protein
MKSRSDKIHVSHITATTNDRSNHCIALSSAPNNESLDAAKELMSSNKRPNTGSLVDSMLSEANDLVGAAAEAQALGRLKMSNSYLLLVHARLITLGKRFDRSLTPFPINKLGCKKACETKCAPISKHCHDRCDDVNPNSHSVNKTSSQPNSFCDTGSEIPPVCASMESGEASLLPADDEKAAAVAKTLTKIIPSGITFDATMMEHLAKAALDLHHKRRGDTFASIGLLQSENLLNNGINSVTSSTEQPKTSIKSRIAWTDEEHKRCIDAVDELGRSKTKEIAQAVGTRTEKEVIAHLRNASEKEKATQSLHQELASLSEV